MFIYTKLKLQISKPCYNCIQTIKIIPLKKDYKIKEIYYSNSEGNIIKTSLENLDKEEYHYTRHDNPIK